MKIKINDFTNMADEMVVKCIIFQTLKNKVMNYGNSNDWEKASLFFFCLDLSQSELANGFINFQHGLLTFDKIAKRFKTATVLTNDCF